MKRIIEIKGRTGRFDVPSFLLTENEELIIELKTKEIRVGRYVLTVLCGEQKKTVYMSKDMTVTLTPDWLAKGGASTLEIRLEFRSVDGTRIIIPSAKSQTDRGGFIIEPLYLERIDDSLTAYGWFSKVENELEELRGQIASANAELATYREEGVPLLPAEE